MADNPRQPLLAIAPSAPSFVDLHAAPTSSGEREREREIFLNGPGFPSEQERILSEWAQYEYASNSSRKPGAVEPYTVVTGNEIRAAASSDPYPVWIYGALITPEDAQEDIVSGGSEMLGLHHVHGQQLQEHGQKSAETMEEEEIRELLVDHVSHHCCWARKPARKWSIQKIEDCNSYVGTLETFIEERDVIDEVEPYTGGNIDGKENGRMLGAWEIDMKSEFPLLFVSRKEARTKLPHSEFVERCPGIVYQSPSFDIE